MHNKIVGNTVSDTAVPTNTAIVSEPTKVEPSFQLLTPDNKDELVHTTYMHPVDVQDMGAYAFWTNHEGTYAPNNQERCMHGRGSQQELVQIFSSANKGDQISYYFGSPRPPEQVVYTWKFLPWRLFTLKSIGWGPPTEPKEDGVHIK